MSSIKGLLSKPLEKWQTLANRINAMSVRDRLILLIGLLAVIYFFWWVFLRLPLQSQTTRLMTQFQATGNQLSILQQQAERISQKVVSPEVNKEQQQVVELEKQVALLGQELQNYKGRVIPYDKLADMLRELIMEHKELQLTSIQSPQARVILEAPGQRLIEQSIILTFQSDNYFATLNYLKRLEGLEWKIFWDQLNYKVDNYPLATVSIRVHSLGYEYQRLGGGNDQ